MIVSENPKPATCPIAYAEVPNIREALAIAAKNFYGAADESMSVAAITGTNGKTTVAWLSQYLLKGSNKDVGLFSTIQYDLADRILPAYRTTPDSLEIYAMLAEMKSAGVDKVVMEVTSHALDQNRVKGLDVDVAVFLNLTQDHIDYHNNMDAYFQAKRSLFAGSVTSLPKKAVVNLDDPYGKKLAEDLPENIELITFGLGSSAMIRAENIQLTSSSSTFDLVWGDNREQVVFPLAGHYNVLNALAGFGLSWAMGKEPAQIVKQFSSFEGVPGRMERVDCGQNFDVFVDYAHTDDALANALGMLKEITAGDVLLVFGCGGDRDRQKRPMMAQAAQTGSDRCWATADNPRGESVAQIFDDMRLGVDSSATIRFVEDRRQAIDEALRSAKPGDCVLIAGKGHEAFQEFSDRVISFDDRQVVRQLLKSL